MRARHPSQNVDADNFGWPRSPADTIRLPARNFRGGASLGPRVAHPDIVQRIARTEPEGLPNMSLGFLCAPDKYLSNSDKVIRTGEISIQPQCMLAFGDAAQHAWATFLQVPGTYVRAHGLGPMTGLWTTSLRLLRRSRQDQVQIQARLQSMLASSVRPSRRPDSKSPWRKISVAGHVPCRRSNERI